MIISPNFLYVDPDKSGSSWLFKVLESHPECFVPECKDIYYFDNYYDRGADWYLKFFEKSAPHCKAIAEISHGYLFDEQVPARVYENFPSMKIMAALRNPVERSISHYFYLKSSGLIKSDFKSAIKERPGILRSSLYYYSVKRYMDLFPAEQLKITFFDDLQKSPRDYAFDIFQFLGLKQIDCMDFDEKVREARKPKNYLLARTLKLAAIRARDLGLTNLVGKIKNSDAVNLLYKPLGQGEKQQVSDDVKLWLLDHFAEDISRLESLMGVDLSHWKTRESEILARESDGRYA